LSNHINYVSIQKTSNTIAGFRGRGSVRGSEGVTQSDALTCMGFVSEFKGFCIPEFISL